MSQPPTNNSKPQRILIVDDYKEAAVAFQQGFELLTDFEVTIALNSKQALQHCEDQPFDLLIADYEMPEVDGVTLAVWIQAMYPETAVILVTGFAEVMSPHQINDVAIHAILSKPVDFTELCRVAAEALQSRNNLQVND